VYLLSVDVPSLGGSLIQLEHLMRRLDALMTQAKIDLRRFFVLGTYPPSLLEKIQRCLAETEGGGAALCRIRELNFPANDYDRCLESARIVKAELVKVTNKLADRLKGSSTPTRPVSSAGHTRYSKADADRLKRIGEDQFGKKTDLQLFRENRFKEKSRSLSKDAFRASCTRIRKQKGFPPSSAVRKAQQNGQL